VTATETHAHHDNGTLPTIPPIDVGPVRKVAIGATVVGLGAFAIFTGINMGITHETGTRDFFFAWLVGFVFWVCPTFGALGLLMIAYCTQASWGVVYRRILQACTRCIPVVIVLFIPIALSLFILDGKASPFWWADRTVFHVPDDQKNDDFKKTAARHEENGWSKEISEVSAARHTRPEAIEEEHHKIHDYLNPGFFIARFVAYIIIFGGMMLLLNGFARKAEDADDAESKKKLLQISGPGIVVWCLSMTFAVTDWVMSVEPTWASSMFPVVFGMNAFIITFSICALVFYTLNQKNQQVLSIIKNKFRIDIGTMLFAATMVWAYATFCQYMLIWAGNLPEENSYYLRRGNGGWEYLAYFLMAFHWLIPFVVFLFRSVKTNPNAMRFMACLLLTVCLADVIWWIIPSIPHAEGGLYVPMAVSAVVGFGGVWGLWFARELAKRPILASNSEVKFLAAWGHHH